jgi:hypothetical protein
MYSTFINLQSLFIFLSQAMSQEEETAGDWPTEPFLDLEEDPWPGFETEEKVPQLLADPKWAEVNDKYLEMLKTEAQIELDTQVAVELAYDEAFAALGVTKDPPPLEKKKEEEPGPILKPPPAAATVQTKVYKYDEQLINLYNKMKAIQRNLSTTQDQVTWVLKKLDRMMKP